MKRFLLCNHTIINVDDISIVDLQGGKGNQVAVVVFKSGNDNLLLEQDAKDSLRSMDDFLKELLLLQD